MLLVQANEGIDQCLPLTLLHLLGSATSRYLLTIGFRTIATMRRANGEANDRVRTQLLCAGTLVTLMQVVFIPCPIATAFASRDCRSFPCCTTAFCALYLYP